MDILLQVFEEGRLTRWCGVKWPFSVKLSLS